MARKSVPLFSYDDEWLRFVDLIDFIGEPKIRNYRRGGGNQYLIFCESVPEREVLPVTHVFSSEFTRQMLLQETFVCFKILAGFEQLQTTF